MSTTAKSPGQAATAPPDNIAQWLHLVVGPDMVVELRILGVVDNSKYPSFTISGYFDYDHLDELARAAWEWTEKAEGCYVTVNPVRPDLLARAANRVIKKPKHTTTDAEIAQRIGLVFDADPNRPAGISASDAEKAHAWERINQLVAELERRGWSAPILADSGNGYHSRFLIDAPAQDGGLVERALKAAAAMFTDDRVKIDTALSNPARIIKLYGTMARKGDSTDARPHRCSKVLSVPDSYEVVPIELLEDLAAEWISDRPDTSAPPEESRAQSNGLKVRASRNEWTDGARARSCVFSPKVPESIEGQHGHDRLYNVACILVDDFGLSRDEAMPIFRDWNAAKAHPPESEYQLNHKLDDAIKNHSVPSRRLLLEARRDRTSSSNGKAHTSGMNGTARTERKPFSLDLVTSERFFASTYDLQWLVEDVLVRDEPIIIGGPSKTLKTSILIDLVIALASATPFLGRFNVPRVARSAFISGESGRRVIQVNAKQVCLSRGIMNRSELPIHWGFKLPTLTYPEHLDVLRKAIEDNGIEFIALDPFYLMVLGKTVDPKSMFDMGPLLSEVSALCLEAGCTPILAHHFTKNREHAHGLPEMAELAYAGVAQFMRQWILVSPREKFNAEIGKFFLHFVYGGSAGHCGEIALDIEVGKLTRERDGRKWVVTVATPSEERTSKQEQKRAQGERMDAEKAEAKGAQEREDAARMLAAFHATPHGEATKGFLRAALGINAEKADRLLFLLKSDGLIQDALVTIPNGPGRTKQAVGFKVVHPLSRTRFGSKP